ncbi:hypothetical protein ACSNKO_18890 [Proteus mirabilis]
MESELIQVPKDLLEELASEYQSNKWTADCLDYDFMSVNKNPYRGAMEVF